MAKKGESLSWETKRKISEAMKGKVRSAETRRKISESNKGKVLSAGTRRKISEGWNGDNQGEKNPNHTLSEKDVVAIKKALKDPYWGIQKHLALKYSVCFSAISSIKNGRSWNHVREV